MIQVRVPPYFLTPVPEEGSEATVAAGVVAAAVFVAAAVVGAEVVAAGLDVAGEVVVADVVAGAVVVVPELQPVITKAATNTIAKGTSSFFNLSSYKIFD